MEFSQEISSGTVITWIGLLVGWFTVAKQNAKNASAQSQRVDDSLELFKNWIREHQVEAEMRDKTLRLLEITVARLEVIAELSQRQTEEFMRILRGTSIREHIQFQKREENR